MKKLPVGLQVYGLRDLLEGHPENFEDVMRKVKEMGYDGVELAGLYGIAPEKIKEILDRVGLVPISAHVPQAEMAENLDKVISDYKKIGVKFIVNPYLPEHIRPNTEKYPKALFEMNRIGNIIAENGMTFLYHNHDFEFVKMPDGTFGFDDIYKNVSPDAMKAEPDTCWIEVAGQSAVAYIKKYSGRCPIVHLKDFIKKGNPKNLYKLIGIETKESKEDEGFFEFRPVGFGQQIWEPILEASVESGAEWVVVEQDEHYNLSSLECARRSREYLKILGW